MDTLNFMSISFIAIIVIVIILSIVWFLTADINVIQEDVKQNASAVLKIPEVKLLVWVDITFPDEEGVWKIKIVPVEYEDKLVYMEGQRFGKKVKYESLISIRIFEEHADNIISEDAPLAKAILGKKEGDSYFYLDNNNQEVRGKIVKIYTE